MKLSKWIKDLTKAIFYGQSDDGESPDQVTEKIDKLLRRAAGSTEDTKLYDDIQKELSDENQ